MNRHTGLSEAAVITGRVPMCRAETHLLEDAIVAVTFSMLAVVGVVLWLSWIAARELIDYAKQVI